MEGQLAEANAPMAALEESLNEVKSQYACKFGHSIDEEVVEKDGIKFSVTGIVVKGAGSGS